MDAVLKGPQESIELGSSVAGVGRSPANQLRVNDPEVSWFHAQICPQGQSHIVVDLGSRNGTFVNEHKLPPKTPHRLNVGDTVRFGNTMFSYRTDASPHPLTKVATPRSMYIVEDFQQQQPYAQSQWDQQSHPSSSAPPIPNSTHPQQTKEPHNVNEQQVTNKSNRKRNVITSAVIAAVITAVATIMAAWINVHPAPPVPTPTPVSQQTQAPTPAPTQASIPRLHPSYTGSLSLVRIAPGYHDPPSGPIMFSSIAEDDQGRVQSADMVLGSAKYTCQGSVDASRNLVLSCTKVGDANYHVIVNGHVFQDSGQLSGTLSASDPLYPSFYEDETWSAQG